MSDTKYSSDALDDIDLEVNFHPNRIISRLYAEFNARTDHYISTEGSKTSGALPRKYEDPYERAVLFNRLLEEQYLSLMRDTVQEVKDLFNQHDIGFRLHNADAIIHGYHQITFLWFIDNHEYVFDFLWDSSVINPFPAFYKTGVINGCGEILDGDILHDSGQNFEDEIPLPKWFIDGLSRES